MKNLKQAIKLLSGQDIDYSDIIELLRYHYDDSTFKISDKKVKEVKEILQEIADNNGIEEYGKTNKYNTITKLITIFPESLRDIDYESTYAYMILYVDKEEDISIRLICYDVEGFDRSKVCEINVDGEL